MRVVSCLQWSMCYSPPHHFFFPSVFSVPSRRLLLLCLQKSISSKSPRSLKSVSLSQLSPKHMFNYHACSETGKTNQRTLWHYSHMGGSRSVGQPAQSVMARQCSGSEYSDRFWQAWTAASREEAFSLNRGGRRVRQNVIMFKDKLCVIDIWMLCYKERQIMCNVCEIRNQSIDLSAGLHNLSVCVFSMWFFFFLSL